MSLAFGLWLEINFYIRMANCWGNRVINGIELLRPQRGECVCAFLKIYLYVFPSAFYSAYSCLTIWIGISWFNFGIKSLTVFPRERSVMHMFSVSLSRQTLTMKALHVIKVSAPGHMVLSQYIVMLCVNTSLCSSVMDCCMVSFTIIRVAIYKRAMHTVQHVYILYPLIVILNTYCYGCQSHLEASILNWIYDILSYSEMWLGCIALIRPDHLIGSHSSTERSNPKSLVAEGAI